MYKHFKDLSSTETDVSDGECVHERCATETNLELNIPFTEIEILKTIKELKNNKPYGSDLLIHEYIKSTGDLMLPIYVKLFNIILNTGFILSNWLEGLIKPLYKKKGE